MSKEIAAYESALKAHRYAWSTGGVPASLRALAIQSKTASQFDVQSIQHLSPAGEDERIVLDMSKCSPMRIAQLARAAFRGEVEEEPN